MLPGVGPRLEQRHIAGRMHRKCEEGGVRGVTEGPHHQRSWWHERYSRHAKTNRNSEKPTVTNRATQARDRMAQPQQGS